MARSSFSKNFLIFLIMLLPLMLTGCPPMKMGGQTGVTEECVGRVKEGPWGVKKLDCEHKCSDGSDCKWQSSTDDKGVMREWCGCSKTEPDNCHLYIETPKDGSPKVDCTGSCPKAGDKDQECKKKEVPKGDVKDVSCNCEKK